MSLLLAGVWAVQAAVSLGTGAEYVRPVAYVTGDGALTVGVDEHGAIVQFYWPSPGRWEQMTGSAGATWVIWDGQSWTTLSADGWRAQTGYVASDSLVLSTRFEEIDGTRSADQRIFAWPGNDVLVVELRLYGFDAATRIGWRQQFSPGQYAVTGMGTVPGYQGTTTDIEVAYGGPDTGLLHFRRSDAGVTGAGDRHESDYTAYHAAEGVVIATHSLQPVVAGGISRARGEAPLIGSDAQSASGSGFIELEAAHQDTMLTATVLIAPGTTIDSAAAGLQRARKSAFPTMLAEAEQSGIDWLRGATLQSDRSPLQARSILNLLLCIDRKSGVVLRAPVSRPPHAVASVVDTAFAAAALDDLGFTDLAGRIVMHHVETVRSETSAGLPAGSLPAETYADGRPARFSAAADPASAAWLLAACWRHTIRLPADAAREFIEPIWPSISASADYLALAPQYGSPYGGSLRSDMLRDTLEVRYLGLECARRLSETVMKQTEPSLRTDCRTELYARIRSRMLNSGNEGATTDAWVTRWLASLEPHQEHHEGWEPIAGDGAPGMDLERAMPDVPDSVPHAMREALHYFSSRSR